MDVLVIGKSRIPEESIKAAGWRVHRCDHLDLHELAALDGKALVVFLKALPDPDQTVKALQKIKAKTPEPYVIVLTEAPRFEEAVYVMKKGADDFWVLPAPEERFLSTLEWVRDTFFSQAFPSEGGEGVERPIISVSPSMQEIKRIAAQVARSDASVFIQGESGTGKELFARFIHARSHRSGGPFVAVNCAAIPETLLESELFGFERGAFTGATRQKPGKFELAHGGTLLLDEVTEVPVHLQAKLLRVLQEGEIDRIGGKKPVKVNVRVIATTNVPVEERVKEGTFRKDLYYRLNVIPLKIPPLRDRVEDIIPLTNYFVQRFCKTYGMPSKRLAPEAEKKLLHHTWPGNVRELENVIHRAVLLSSGREILPSEIVFDSIELGGSPLRLMPIREMEREMIFKALEVSDGNRTKAAEILGITVRTLRNKLKEYKEQGLL